MNGLVKNLKSDALRYDSHFSIRLVIHLLIQRPGFSAVIWIRVMQSIQHFPLRLIRLLVTNIVRSKMISRYGIDVEYGCIIGPGLKIDHPVGIVIGSGVVIGHTATILSGCVIGEKYVDQRSTGEYPKLGNRVTLGCNTLIIGDVTIGDNVQIGAGSIVLKSVKSDQSVSGLVK